MFDALVTWFKATIQPLNRIPETIWNKYFAGLLGVYDGSKDHDITSLVFYWREICHFAGGLTVGLLSAPLFLIPMPKLISALLPVVVVAVIVGLNEFLGDASEQPNGWDFKNVVDTVVWTAGVASVSFTILSLIK